MDKQLKSDTGHIQAAAILPGISRSGSTIATGMIIGISPQKAAEYAFLLGIPVILGGVLLKAGDLLNLGGGLAGPYLAGVLVSGEEESVRDLAAESTRHMDEAHEPNHRGER